MGINPPSFYAAFGNKAQLFAQILDNYTDNWVGQVRAAFALHRPVAQCLADIARLAAHNYAAIKLHDTIYTPQRRGGCLILEAGLNCSDPQVAEHIRKARMALATAIYRGVSRTEPERAATLTDQMMTLLAGLSAMARDGTGLERLLAIAASLATHLGDV
jgi:TetR/AcrR family transcriptional repressor for divergent bdcA